MTLFTKVVELLKYKLSTAEFEALQLEDPTGAKVTEALKQMPKGEPTGEYAFDAQHYPQANIALVANSAELTDFATALQSNAKVVTQRVETQGSTPELEQAAKIFNLLAQGIDRLINQTIKAE